MFAVRITNFIDDENSDDVGVKTDFHAFYFPTFFAFFSCAPNDIFVRLVGTDWR